MVRKRADQRIREQPYGSANFLVDLGEGDPWSAASGFSEVVFPGFHVNASPGKSSSTPQEPSIPSDTSDPSSHLILRRGFTGAINLYKWWDETRRRKKKPKRTVSVSLLAEDHATVVCTWQFLNACPVRLSYSALNALSDSVLLETIELEFEAMEMR